MSELESTESAKNPNGRYLLKRASIQVSILYVLCFVLMQVQIGIFTNKNWWGFPNAPSIDYLIRRNAIYAVGTVLLLLSIVELMKNKFSSWLYLVVSSAVGLVWQTYLLAQRDILAFSGGKINYAMMGLEVALCTLLLIEHPSAVRKSRDDKTKREEGK